jgi:uncharacterized protein
MKGVIKKIAYIPRVPLLWLIRLYQKTLSPDHGFFKFLYANGYCKYYPTCSQYGHDVIKKRGLFVGIPKTMWRILRCNPWSKGGIDIPK